MDPFNAKTLAVRAAATPYAATSSVAMLPGWGWAVLGATLLALTVIAVLALVVLDHWSSADAESDDHGLSVFALADGVRARIESLLSPGVLAPLAVVEQADGERSGAQP